MKSRNLPDVVEATFGVGSDLSVKLLTSGTLLQEKHIPSWPVSSPISALRKAHSILRFASHNYYYNSQIPDPDPCLSGGLGQQ
jgi:hypothetical protein